METWLTFVSWESPGSWRLYKFTCNALPSILVFLHLLVRICWSEWRETKQWSLWLQRPEKQFIRTAAQNSNTATTILLLQHLHKCCNAGRFSCKKILQNSLAFCFVITGIVIVDCEQSSYYPQILCKSTV